MLHAQKGEAISLVATAASKLAAVEDVGPKRPEASPTATAKVSPATRATLQALKITKSRINTPTRTFRDAETITGKYVIIFLIDLCAKVTSR